MLTKMLLPKYPPWEIPATGQEYETVEVDLTGWSEYIDPSEGIDLSPENPDLPSEEELEFFVKHGYKKPPEGIEHGKG